VEKADRHDRRPEENLAKRRRRGLLAALLTLVVAAYPVVGTASLAHAGFSGCWLTCGGDPNPVVGLLWTIVAAVLLATPVALGMSIATVRSWAAWVTAALAVALAASAWVAFSLDPAHAAFFVKLGE
jgi:hypothetical protein